jgi:hypothetical protein
METEIGLLREEALRRDQAGEDEAEELEREKESLERFLQRDYENLMS